MNETEAALDEIELEQARKAAANGEKLDQTLSVKTLLSDEEISAIFLGKCEDYSITPNKKLLERFIANQRKKTFAKIFEMNATNLGPIAGDIICQIILNHPHIKAISLRENAVGNEGALAIATLLLQTPQIVSLDLASNSIQDEGARAIFYALESNKSLFQLILGSASGLHRNSLGAKSCKELAEMLAANKVLAELDLAMSEITVDLMMTITKGLKQNITLSSLNLANNNIQSRGCKRLFNALVHTHLSSLNISSNQIRDDVAPEFINYISKNKYIKSINLASNQLTKAFTKSIAQGFASQSHLSELILAHNPLCGVGVEELGHALAINKYINRLDLSMCQIDFVGFQSFCSKLQNNQSITYISLSNNPIGDKGAQSLAGVIRNHLTLKEIELELCEFTDEGGNILVPEFEHSVAIQKVNLKNNLIRNFKLIQQVIQNNPRLIYFNVEFNDIDFKYFTELTKTIKNNYRAWVEKKKDKIKEEVAQTKEIEQDLYNTRQQIVEERENLRELLEEIDALKKEADEAKTSKETTLTDLQKEFDTISEEQVTTQTEQSETNHRMTTEKDELEVTVSHLTKEKESKIEAFTRDNGMLAQMDVKINDAKVQIENGNKDLKNNVLEAQQRYLDAKQLFLDAYNQSHLFITKAPVVNEPPEAPTSSDQPSAKKKGKKSDSKKEAKPRKKSPKKSERKSDRSKKIKRPPAAGDIP